MRTNVTLKRVDEYGWLIRIGSPGHSVLLGIPGKSGREPYLLRGFAIHRAKILVKKYGQLLRLHKSLKI